jgi:tetratricopeptide (TPR) repeat protein
MSMSLRKFPKRAALALLLALGAAAGADAEQVFEIDPSLLSEHMQEQQGGRAQEVARARNEIISMWFRYRHHIERNDLTRANEALEEIRQYSRKAMVDESHRLGLALLYQGYQFYEVHQDDMALDALDKALSFAPYLYPAHEGKARIFFRRNPYNPFPWLVEGVRSLRARFNYFWSTYNAVSNSMSALFAAIGIFAAAMMAMGVMRNLRLAYHEMMEQWRRILPYDLALLLGGGVLFLPSFLWLGPLWYIPLWAILFWGYFNFSEKAGTAAFLLWLACLAPALSFGKHLTLIPGDPYLRASVSAASGQFDETRVAYLKEMLQKDPYNPFLSFVLGTLYQNGGYADEAKQHYAQAIEQKPDYVEAYINLGNLYFNLQEPYEAIRLYKKSIEFRPTALAYHNMSRAYTSVFDFPNANDALEQASSLRPEETSVYSTMREGMPDAKIEMADLRRQFFETSRSGLGEAASAAFSWSNFLNPLSFLALGSLATIGVFAFLRRRAVRARACVKCGRIFCDRCRAGLETESYCSQCSHIFIRKDGVSPSVRSRKTYEMQRYARRKRIFYHLINVLIPGGGQLYLGRQAYGFFALSVWALGVATILAREWTLNDTFAIVSAFNVVSGFLGWTAAALAWLIANPLGWVFGQAEE